MAELNKPLQKPSQAIAKRLSIYFNELNWVSDTNLLNLSIGLLTGVSDVTILELNLHHDGSIVSYTAVTAYRVHHSQADIVRKGIGNILTSKLSSGADHIQKGDTSDPEGSWFVAVHVDAYWTTRYDA